MPMQAAVEGMGVALGHAFDDRAGAGAGNAGLPVRRPCDRAGQIPAGHGAGVDGQTPGAGVPGVGARPSKQQTFAIAEQKDGEPTTRHGARPDRRRNALRRHGAGAEGGSKNAHDDDRNERAKRMDKRREASGSGAGGRARGSDARAGERSGAERAERPAQPHGDIGRLDDDPAGLGRANDDERQPDWLQDPVQRRDGLAVCCPTPRHVLAQRSGFSKTLQFPRTERDRTE